MTDANESHGIAMLCDVIPSTRVAGEKVGTFDDEHGSVEAR